jgi:PAS domain S-box-containing protein
MFFEDGLRRHYILIVSTILIGVVTSVAAFVASRNGDYQKLLLSFKITAEHRYETLRMEMERDLGTLESLQALYASNDHITRFQFGDFARYSLSKHSSIQALEWIPRVSADKRESYERDARRQGFRAFQITEKDNREKMARAPNRTELFPVYFVQPYRGNEAALGFDLGSNPARRTALEEARDTGGMTASRRIKLVQEKADQYGFLVFAPVYRRGAPLHTVEGRRKNLRGFVLGVFRIGDMLEKTLGSRLQEDIPFSVYDTAAPEEERFLYHHSSRRFPNTAAPGAGMEPAADVPFHFDKRMNIAGREWLLVFATDPDYIAHNRARQPWVVLFTGLLLTGFVTYLLTNARHVRLLSVINSHLRDEVVERKEVEKALRESEERYRIAIESSNDGIALAKEGMHLFVNRRFLEIFGYDQEEAASMESFAPVHPDDRERVRDITAKRMREEEVPSRYEFKGMRKDGTELDIEAAVVPVVYRGDHVSLVYFRDITERKMAGAALRETEELYRIAFENSNEGIALARKDKLIFVNPRFLEISGYDSEEEVLHIDSSVLIHPADRERISMLANMRMRGEPVPARYDFRCVRKDGTEYDVEANVASFLYRGEKASLIHFRDITERKLAEELLRESENKFRDLVEEAIAGVFLIQDGVFKYVNSRFAEIHGYEVDELIDRKGPQDTVVTEDLAELKENLRKHLPDWADLVRAKEFRIKTKQGETRNVEIYTTDTIYRGKRALIGTLLDITERKATEEALQWKTAFLEALLDASSDGILVIDGQGKSILQNQRTVDLWKIPQEIVDRKDDEAQARHVLSVVKDPDKFNHQVLYLYSHPNESIRDEVELLDGTILDRHSSPVVGKDGTYYGRIFGFHDITERRQAEELLKRIVTSSPMGIFILQHGETQLVNSQFENFTGYTEEEAIGMNFLNLVHPDDRAKVLDLARKMLKAELTTPYEYRITTKSGEIRTLMETVTPIHYRGEKAVLGNVMNITDRKALESQLAQS